MNASLNCSQTSRNRAYKQNLLMFTMCVASMPPEAQLSTCLDTVAYHDKKKAAADTKCVKTATAKVWVHYNASASDFTSCFDKNASWCTKQTHSALERCP